jgi:hypothetical protein
MSGPTPRLLPKCLFGFPHIQNEFSEIFESSNTSEASEGIGYIEYIGTIE